jgi:V-type H+-transporting ATPase subunit G
MYGSLASVHSETLIYLAGADRTQRLKDAHSEATKEIEAYKAQKEQEFKAYEASVRTILSISHDGFRADPRGRQHAGNTQSVQAAVDKETDSKLTVISQQFEGNKDAVVKKLLDRVILVKPELHRNLEKLGA